MYSDTPGATIAAMSGCRVLPGARLLYAFISQAGKQPDNTG
jgi:hypothetical protein